MIRWAAVAVCLALPVAAQDIVIVPQIESFELEPLGDPLADQPSIETTQTAPEVERAPGAQLRGLDKLNGEVVDFELENGNSVVLGHLRVDLSDCRYPAGNPAGDAYAFLSVFDGDETEPVFRGWMVASSPALSALDHARYDIWVLRCNTSATDGSSDN